MKRSVALVAGALVAALALAGCHGGDAQRNSPQTPQEQTKPKPKPKPVDLTGTWKAPGASSDTWQELTISGDTMEINWVIDNGATKALYWAGTFTAPTEPGDTWSWTSERDGSKTEHALLASREETKEFKFADNTISWQVSVNDASTIVHAARQGS